MLRAIAAATVVLALLPASTAAAAIYRMSYSAKQELTWKVDGTTGDCEVRRGTGSGRVAIRVRSSKPILLNGGGRSLNLLGSIRSVAKGTIEGSFTDSLAAACPGFEPSETSTASQADCGALRFGVRVDFKPRRGFIHITGPETPLGPVSLAQAGQDCPSPVASSLLTSSDLSACGDGRQTWQRSWGVASLRGLFAERIASGRAPRIGRKRAITGRVEVDCTVPSQYTGGVRYQGTLTWTATLKRVR